MRQLGLVIALTLCCQCFSQRVPSQPRFGKSVRSPEVRRDGSVTFRFRAPNAKSASLLIEGAQSPVLTKDENGVWSGTTGVLTPDLYIYSFVMDGVALGDPANPATKSIATGGFESIVAVTGDKKQIWEEGDVPHGVLHRHGYRSQTLGVTRQYLIYTPPGYDARARRKYPTLYLLHGVMETEDSWVAGGRADTILDNLIAGRRAVPMVVVMPLGYGFADVPDGMYDQFNPSKQRSIMDSMGETLLKEVMPQVEQNYRVLRSPAGRAVAGCSMGGAQALYLGLGHADQFGYIGSFSGAFIMYTGEIARWFPTRSPPRLQSLVVACGKDDFLLDSNRRTSQWLKSQGIFPKVWETPGGHTWNVWRRNLSEYAQILFK